MKTEKQRCGAKAKGTGKPCRQWPVKGKTRCRFHGGLSTGPRDCSHLKLNSRAHGVYSKNLSDEEKAMLPTVKVGDLENEIRLLRIMLLRAVKAETERIETREMVNRELDRLFKDGSVSVEALKQLPLCLFMDDKAFKHRNLEKVRKRLMWRHTSFLERILPLARAIGKLEHQRMEMMRESAPGTIEEIAVLFREFAEDANKTVGNG